MRLLRTIVALAALLLFGLAVAAPAQAQVGYGESIDVVPGQVIHLSGIGAVGGTDVSVYIQSEPILLGTTTAAADGSWAIDVTIPFGLECGAHALTALNGEQPVFAATVNLLCEALPRTGSSGTGLLTGVGLAAILLGASFLVGRRRAARTPESAA